MEQWLGHTLSISSPRGAACTVMAAFVALTLAVSPLSAQSGGTSAFVDVEASVGGTTLVGDVEPTATFSILLDLAPRLEIGGTGTFLFGSKTLSGTTAGSDVVMRFAYGGFLARFLLSRQEDRPLWASVLLGAGNAKLSLAVVKTPLAADNFGVVVPELGGSLRLAGPLHLGAALGYRATFGVEDLPDIAPEDLQGVTARLVVSLRHF